MTVPRCALALALLAPLASRAAEPAAPAPAAKTMAEVLAASAPSDWQPLDPENTLYLELASGRVVIVLAPAFAPRHVANVKALVRARYFDGLAILRSQDNYVVQWGDPAPEPGQRRPLGQAAATLAPEFDRPLGDDLPFTPLADGDPYAPEVGFSGGLPVGRDPRAGRVWLAHCYGMVGAGRDEAPGSGNGAELYVVIGHAPRHLDRNVTLLGRVVQGIERLSTLPRGTGNLGFYEDPAQRVPIRTLRLAADVLPEEREDLETLRTDSPAFAALIAARRHRGEPWFAHPVDRIELCNVPLPVRPRPGSAAVALPAAPDWPQWRGPGRDGVAAVAPGALPQSASRAWRVEVGEGYSSPVVAGGRVFVHSRRDPEEVVTAVDLRSGEVVWQQSYGAPFAKNSYAVEMAKGPNSTPLAADGRLFTLGATGVLSAWNAADGALLWRRDESAAVDTSKLFCGTAASPLLEGGSLVVQVGSDVHGGRVLALDPATGAERWAWRGAGPGYASPIVVALDGVRHLVTLTEGSIEGIDAATGASLWSAPFADEWHENIVTPVWTGELLIVSGARQGTRAYALRREGGRWRAEEAWKNPEVTMYMSTPVLAGGTLYGHANKRKGQFVALDAATGALLWATEGREGEHASVLAAPGHLVFLTNHADLILARRSVERFEEAGRLKVADAETWAQPVPLADGVLVRDATGLTRLRFGEVPEPASASRPHRLARLKLGYRGQPRPLPAELRSAESLASGSHRWRGPGRCRTAYLPARRATRVHPATVLGGE